MKTATVHFLPLQLSHDLNIEVYYLAGLSRQNGTQGRLPQTPLKNGKIAVAIYDTATFVYGKK